ncbi:MAG: tryptophan synthase subunit alpha [Candidatus Peregrinibacteria bacterium]
MRLSSVLQNLSAKNQIGLMTHTVVGYPSIAHTKALVKAMAPYVDIIELQIPFSDPVADGPVLLKASQDALENGVTVEDSFHLIAELREEGIKTPLLIMTYANIVMAKGVLAFVEKSAQVGADGFIVPDLPFDTPEGEELYTSAKEKGLCVLPLFAPTTADDRLKFLAQYADTLIYAVARTGITGSKTEFSEELDIFLSKIRSVTKTPIALGFGIQTPEQVHALQGKVEMAVIGTALLKIFDRNGVAGVEEFLKRIREI